MRRGGALWVVVALLASACEGDSELIEIPDRAPTPVVARPVATASVAPEELSPRLLRRYAAIEAPSGPETPLVELGRMLYFEPLLSKSGKVSCNSCHPLGDGYGTTHTAVSTGIEGRRGTRNAPTTYNAAGHFRQFWDGRVATLEEQARGPIEHSSEMGMKSGEVVRVLEGIDGYRAVFARAFPGSARPITMNNVTAAIAAFERGLMTPGRWDRYLHGDTTALSSREKEGAKLFANFGCAVCHTGPYVGGTMIEKLGVHEPWPNQADRGRRQTTANPDDDMRFKVPSLRNIAKTAPYFHDGSVDTLEEAVVKMGRYQLGIELTPDETTAIASWLEALTGDIPQSYIDMPVLPEAKRP